MTKTEATIIRDMFWKGHYIATTERQADKAWEVLKQVLPHHFVCVDRTDDMGAFCQRFEKVQGEHQMQEYAITIGRVQVYLEALYGKRTDFTAQDWRSECLRVCAREELPIKCFDYIADYLVNKYCKN